MKKIMAIFLFLFIFFTGCKEEPEDYSISEITITGIPAQIPVFGNDSVLNDTFKVYLNASNSQSENDLPVAKGLVKVTEAMKQADGTYTVTIKLQKPNPADNKDPNLDTDPWSGTANYFSVVISPKDVSAGAETIWVKAGLTLDKGKENSVWDSTVFMDFRESMRKNPEDNMGFAIKTKALYNEIVCRDPDITTTP